MQVNGVDLPESAADIRAAADTLQDILDGSFGQSLTPENLSFIVHKAILSMHNDLINMQDHTKPSNFSLDKEDLELLANDVLDEIKKSREGGQKALMDLKDEADVFKLVKDKVQTPLNNESTAKNAANVLINYENAIYEALSSESFYEKLKGFIKKYNDIYAEHLHPLKPFEVYSNSFETLTTDLKNPNLQISPVARRLL
jgi:hypothetical protein